MPTLDLQGLGSVTVGPEFLKLSHEEQNRTVDEIAAHLKQQKGIGDRVQGAFDAAAPMEGREVTSGLQAGMRGAGQGVTAGFGDELAAAQSASGLPGFMDVIPGMGLNRAAIGAARTFLSPDASKTYNDRLASERRMDTIAQAEHPVASTAGEVGGMIATAPLGGVAKPGIGLLARAGRSALTGGAQSAAYGFGTGEGAQDRLRQAATQGAIGTGVGALGSGLVDAGAGAMPYLRRALPMGAINPQKEATKRIAGAMVSDTGGDINLARQSIAQVPRLNAAGMPAVIADAGGGATQRLARTAGNLSPQADEVIRSTAQDRFKTQGGRAEQFIRSMIGNFDNVDAQEALKVAARKANKPAYKWAYASGDKPIWSPTLERLTSSPAVVDAMRSAAQRGKDRAVTEGFGGFNPGVTVDPSGIVSFRRGPTGVPTYPNLQYWDYVKRELDDAAGAAIKSNRKGESDTLRDLASQLREELDRVVPSYQSARAGAARFFGANDALEAGKQFLSSRVGNTEARNAIAKMSMPERELFSSGYASQLMKEVREAGDSVNILNSRFVKSPAARERTIMALGSQNAKALEAHLRVEGIMDRLRTSMGNSTTARQLADIAAFGTVGAGYGYITGQSSPTVGAIIAGGARLGKIKLDQRVAEQVGRLLMSNDPQVFEKGLQAVASNQALLNSVRVAQQYLSRSAAAPVAAGMAQN